MKNKKIISIILPILIVLLLLTALIIYITSSNSVSIPAIINSNDTEFNRGDKVTIVKEKKSSYLVKSNTKKAYVDKDKVTHFDLNTDEKYSLVLDVSKFNITNKNFSDTTDFAQFIADNNINCTYIRLCR